MFKQKILRNPVVVSTIVALVLAAIFAAVYLFILEDADKLYLWVGLGIITGFYFTFQLSLWLKKKKQLKSSTFRDGRRSSFNGDPPSSF